MNENSFSRKIYSFSVKFHNTLFSFFAQRKYAKRYPHSLILYPAVIDDDCTIGKNTVIHKNVYLSNTILGDYSFTRSNLINTEVGKFCSIGPGCTFGLPKHPTKKFVSTYPAFYSKNNLGCRISFSDKNQFDEQPERTVIGNDVWIGSNCIIMSGVNLGNGAVIGAGSVVTKNVDNYAIVGGAPAELIRYRFEKEQIDFLNQFKWWDRDIAWITKNCELFLDIEKFCKFAK